MWSKIARWLLPISLALNLFFVVVAIRHNPFLHPRPPGPRDVIGFLKANLSAEDAAIMQQSFAAHFAAMSDSERDNQRYPDRIRAALTAVPFDPEALKAALAEGRAKHAKMEENMADAFVDAASKISADGRAKLAAGEGPGGWRHHGPPPPGGASFGPPGPPPGPPPGEPPPR
jgi:uncharacterized membrane protein